VRDRMAAYLLFPTLACLLLVGAKGQQKVLPVNRLFTVDAGEPTPDLKCVVGFHSIEEEVTWRMNCSEAHTKEMVLSKDLRKALKWVPGRRILKFGSQSNGNPWPGNVTSWVCATIPMSGTVTYDCIPENHAPNWYRTPLRGPALGRHMRKPGCNGAVCYCNSRDFCNENDATRVESNASSPTSSAVLLLTLFVCSVLHGLGTMHHPGGGQC